MQRDKGDEALNPQTTGETAESPPANPPEPPIPEGETSGDTTADAEQAEKDKPKGGFQRRISELSRRQRELREALAAEQARNAELLAKVQSPAQGEPSRDQFESWEDYERAHVRWIARQEFEQVSAERERREAEKSVRSQIETLHAEWTDRLDAAREQFDDLDEYIETVGTQINEGLGEAIKLSPKGPEMVRYLGQNPGELKRLTALSPVAAIYELGRIEARLETKPKVSSAPAPTSGVKTTKAPANALRDEMDTRSWMERRRAEIKGRR